MKNSGVYNNPANQGSASDKKIKSVQDKIGAVITGIGILLFRLRKFFFAVPVAFATIKLATYNLEHLPENVGINLQSTGEFTMTVARNVAVMGPVGLTAACLLLMFCSRKALYPWAISVFTLTLPILLLVSNIYPA